MGDVVAAGLSWLGDLIAPAAEAGGADLGAGLGEAGAGLGSAVGGAGAGAGGLADLVGTGAGLAGGATGLEGTGLAAGAGTGISSLVGTGGTALDTAGSFLAAPDASLLGGAASTGGQLLGTGAAASGADVAASQAASSGLASGISGIVSPESPLNALVGATGTTGFNPSVGPGTTAVTGNPNSVFNTGTTPIAGSAAQPAAAGAPSVSAPAGVAPATGVDPTAAGGAANVAGGGSATGTGAASGSTSISSLLGNAGSGAIDSLTKNPIPVALGAAGLGYNIYKGTQDTANQKALSADAATATANSNNMVASGEALQQYLTSGTLPPQYMTQVQQAIADAKTSAIANAAAQGLPTDPTKNTALATTLAKIDASEPQMISQVASQLFSSGSSLVSAGQSAAGLSGQLYQALVANDTTQAANTGKAIATLAAALNGKTNANVGGTNIQLSQG